MKVFGPKDQTERNLQWMKKQLKQCASNEEYSKEIQSSAKFKSISSKTSLKQFLKYQQNTIPSNNTITNTEQKLQFKSNTQDAEQSANSLILGKSPNNDVAVLLQNSKRSNLRPRRAHQKKLVQLKDVIKNQKIKNIKKAFLSKIKRNNQYSKPVEFQFQGKQRLGFLNSKGVQFGQIEDRIINILSIFNIVSSIIIYTLSVAFPQIRESLIFISIEVFGAVVFFTEIILNLITIRFSLGKRLQTLKEIGFDYMKNRFIVDIINLLIIIIYLSTENFNIGLLRFVIFFKLHDCLQKIQKLEVYFIQNYYNEQYWSLVKVFLFNFCFAHMLAILLISMSNVNPNENWLVNKNLINSPWYQKYIWSYYWGTTIMLTIGFGDIIPVCYKQALCMIFIQTVSCIVLAYNINCVGTLIANIRSQDIQKSKNMKIFKKLADKHNINQSLVWKINSYIQENNNIKKLFNIEEEAQFVSRLPYAFKADYLKQANKSIFQQLFFFNNLMEKTLFSLAEKIQMKIAHPEELIAFGVQKNFDIFILKHGQIGFISRLSNRKYNKNIFDSKKVLKNESPFLLNTNFITKNKLSYGIKSLVYSVLYYLQYDSLIDILKQSNMDYELYCRYRDKNKNKIDEFEVYPCQFCENQNHTKFDCPKLHFIPLQQHVINKYMYNEQRGKDYRKNQIERIQHIKQPSLKNYLDNTYIYRQKKKQETTLASSTKAKQQKFVINQLKTIQNQISELDFNSQNNSSLQAFTKIQNKFLENTTQLIKIEISKARNIQDGEDITWEINLDRMKNYKDYFAENNACNLTFTFKLEQRIQKLAISEKNKALRNMIKSSSLCRFDSLDINENGFERKRKISK